MINFKLSNFKPSNFKPNPDSKPNFKLSNSQTLELSNSRT